MLDLVVQKMISQGGGRNDTFEHWQQSQYYCLSHAKEREAKHLLLAGDFKTYKPQTIEEDFALVDPKQRYLEKPRPRSGFISLSLHSVMHWLMGHLVGDSVFDSETACGVSVVKVLVRSYRSSPR